MRPVILFRGCLAEEEELTAARKYFKVVEQRTEIHQGSLVIPRYSALPFYQELEQDMCNMRCQLINSYEQHCYVADIVCKHINFFVVDVAKTANGNWILMELNDGQQSGLSMIDPDIFYENLEALLTLRE